eukprot:366350-Chlamydomonas_euryale.AAC.6
MGPVGKQPSGCDARKEVWGVDCTSWLGGQNADAAPMLDDRQYCTAVRFMTQVGPLLRLFKDAASILNTNGQHQTFFKHQHTAAGSSRIVKSHQQHAVCGHVLNGRVCPHVVTPRLRTEAGLGLAKQPCRLRSRIPGGGQRRAVRETD